MTSTRADPLITLLELVVDVVVSVLWVPEPRWLRLIVLAVYAALFIAALGGLIAALM